MATIEKTGYISELTITVEGGDQPWGASERVIFVKVTVTDDLAGMLNPVTFVMDRKSAYQSDSSADWHGLSRSSAQIGIAAALKDAYLLRKRVILLSGFFDPRVHEPPDLLRVTLSERSGPYMFQTKPGSMVNVNEMGQPFHASRKARRAARPTKKAQRQHP